MSSLVATRKHVRIEPPWQGLSVLEVARRTSPEVSARAVFRMARRAELLLNGERCHPLDAVRASDLVTLVFHLPPAPSPSAPTAVDQWVETPAGPFLIVREDADLLAVSKPPGCASHPALGHWGDTLIERVRHYLRVGPEDDFQPALANRLDIETSGLVLIAKSRRAQRRLGRHLQRGKIGKSYQTLVGGWPEPSSGEICLPLVRRPDSRDCARFPNGHPKREPILQDSLTLYSTLRRLAHPVRCALLQVELRTGRTHQIRRHLAAIGHPVGGDRRYGDRGLNRVLHQACGLERMFLHACRVELSHPASGEALPIDAPLPPDLQACLQTLGSASPQQS